MARCILLLAILFSVTVLSPPPDSDACCAVSHFGQPVVNADQTVIILWDAATKTQHFIRQASFKGDADDFGFLVPSPTQPELSESGDDAFPHLRKLTEPEVIRKTSPLRHLNCSCAAAIPDESLSSLGSVKVLEEKLVAGFNAAVLETKSAAALVLWLQERGYTFSPEVEAWAKPYIDAGWKITALKVAKSKDSKDNKTSAAALRMSFKTDRPIFPYREPAYKGVNEKVGVKSRLLRIYFLAEARYDGEFAKDSPWSGKVAWAGKLDAAARSKLLEQLKLPPITGPTHWWLTEFEDDWSYQPAVGDVYFRPARTQEAVRRPAITLYGAGRVPHDGAVYALICVAAMSSLLVRFGRRKTS